MNYPNLSQELIYMLKQDQVEIVNYSRDNSGFSAMSRLKRQSELNKNCRIRAQRLLEILNIIKLPTIEAVGEKGVQAISVLALHSSYSVMKSVLYLIKKAHRLNQGSVDFEGIATLTDRLRILEGKQQMYGTQWLLGEDNKPFLYPIYNFDKVNERRSKYNLKQIKFPVNLASSNERSVNANNNIKSYIRKPSPQEFKDYVSPYID